jgi:type II secretory pathway component GspD/PulD (secretin)
MRTAVQKLMRYAALAAVAVCTVVLAQSTVLEVIPLKYRTAEQVIPLIRPLLAPEGTVSGLQNQLAIRTTPANLEEIRRVLASIDNRPRTLLITVRQDAESERSRSAAEVSGSVGAGRSRVVVPESGDRSGASVVLQDGDDRLQARVLDSRSVDSERNVQTLQVLEGSSAYIGVGQSVGVPRRQVVRRVVGGRVVEQVVEILEYRDVATGFYVLPRVTGERVMLEISPQRESFDRRIPGAIEMQRVVTTVSGRLGEWIEIGGLQQYRSEQGSVLLGSRSREGSDIRQVRIKVEELKADGR